MRDALASAEIESEAARTTPHEGLHREPVVEDEDRRVADLRVLGDLDIVVPDVGVLATDPRDGALARERMEAGVRRGLALPGGRRTRIEGVDGHLDHVALEDARFDLHESASKFVEHGLGGAREDLVSADGREHGGVHAVPELGRDEVAEGRDEVLDGPDSEVRFLDLAAEDRLLLIRDLVGAP